MQCNETMNTAVDDLTAEIEMIFQDLQSAFESSQKCVDDTLDPIKRSPKGISFLTDQFFPLSACCRP